VREARFASAFTFQYSIRPGTPAATLPNQVPKEIVQERYERLAALQDEISWDENQKFVGTEVRVLVGAEARKDAATHRLSGRAEDSRLVHFEVPPHSELPRPGDVVTVTISDAKPYYLLADSQDGSPLRIRRTRAGDAWDRAEAESCAVPAHGSTTSDGVAKVSLGLPTLRPSTPSVATSPIYDITDGLR
jgi:tRNA-2-methylthio-N6-dimethylallyladenosine synthase